MNKKKDEINIFTTKSYVLIQILPVHNREVFVYQTPLVHLQEIRVNRNTTFSSPRGMCQLKQQLFISKRYVPIKN
jgi:hypothetical protein